MKQRTRNGAMLALAALFVLFIIVLGVGFFFLSKVLGGQRQLDNATDAGALSAAKNGLTYPVADLYKLASKKPLVGGNFYDFFLLSDKAQGANINLLTYNRVVAQSIIVAKNAQLEGTDTAMGHAREVVQAAQQVGSNLRTQLSSEPSPVDSYFNNMAANNPINLMSRGTRVSLTGSVGAAWMSGEGKPLSTNIYFDPTTVSDLDGVPLNNAWKSFKPNPGGKGYPANPSAAYVSGYQPINLLAGSAFQATIYGVPIVPQQPSHLVNRLRFQQSLTPPDGQNGFVPQNSFQGSCIAFDKTANAYTSSSSSSIVGCVDNDYIASLPAGYIKIVNAPLNCQSGDMNTNLSIAGYGGLQAQPIVDYDGSNELLDQSDAAHGDKVMWIALGDFSNNDRRPFGFGPDSKAALKYWSGEPDVSGNPLEKAKTLHEGSKPGQMAVLEDLKKVRGYMPLRDAELDGSEPAWLDQMVAIIDSNYGLSIKALAGIPKNSFTAVEWLKAKIIQLRAKYDEVNPPPIQVPSKVASGLRYYIPYGPDGKVIHYSWPQPKNIPSEYIFERAGTPAQLMQNIAWRNQSNHATQPQLSDMSKNDSDFKNQIFNPIVRAVRQMNPKFTSQDVLSAFTNSSPNIDLVSPSNVLYLHADATGQRLVLDNTPLVPTPPVTSPAAYNPQDVTADGNPMAPYACQYVITGSKPLNASGLIGDDEIKSLVDTAHCDAPDNPANFSSVDAMTAPWGDMKFHRDPWKTFSNTGDYAIQAQDAATFIPSSGYHNCLGELRFSNALQLPNPGNMVTPHQPN